MATPSSSPSPMTKETFLSQPIDLVIPWMSGNDPVWRKRYMDSQGGLIDAGRYKDHGELHFCLWSVSKYMPWIRRVHIITECSLPAYAESFPDLVVTHPDTLLNDVGVTPNFNSNVIESRMHMIPGLSEIFLFGCDDYFVGRPIPKEYWFDERSGLPRSDLRVAVIPQNGMNANNGVMPSLRNTNRIMRGVYGADERLGQDEHFTQSHQFGLLTRTACNIAWKRFRSHLMRLCSLPTREPLSQQLTSHLLFQMVGDREGILSIWVSGKDSEWELFGASSGHTLDQEWQQGTYYARLRALSISPPPFFCLNNIGRPEHYPGNVGLFRRFAGLFARGKPLPPLKVQRPNTNSRSMSMMSGRRR